MQQWPMHANTSVGGTIVLTTEETSGLRATRDRVNSDLCVDYGFYLRLLSLDKSSEAN